MAQRADAKPTATCEPPGSRCCWCSASSSRSRFFLTYDPESGRGNAREGWAYVLTARDLSSLTPEPAVSAVGALLETWDADWDQLGTDKAAGDRVSAAIDEARASTLTVLANLD